MKLTSLNAENERVAVILAGGLGIRLRSVVSDRPKPMADVGGKPFLEYLVQRLLAQKFSRIVFCVGYMKDWITEYFVRNYPSISNFSLEDNPLGTAGALRNAGNLLPRRFVVLNGDTFAPIDYGRLLSFHEEKGAQLTLTLSFAMEGSRFGEVELKDGLVKRFEEKRNLGSSIKYVNAGIYAVSHNILDEIPEDIQYSIEQDLLPRLIRSNVRIAGYVTDTRFVDIGEPQSYADLSRNQSVLRE